MDKLARDGKAYHRVNNGEGEFSVPQTPVDQDADLATFPPRPPRWHKPFIAINSFLFVVSVLSLSISLVTWVRECECTEKEALKKTFAYSPSPSLTSTSPASASKSLQGKGTNEH